MLKMIAALLVLPLAIGHLVEVLNQVLPPGISLLSIVVTALGILVLIWACWIHYQNRRAERSLRRGLDKITYLAASLDQPAYSLRVNKAVDGLYKTLNSPLP